MRSHTIQGRIAGALVVLAACGDGNGGGGGITEPTTGSVRMAVTTTGRVLDRDGYTLSVDGGTPAVVPANYTLIVAGLTPGAHTVTLGGIAENCQAAGSTTLTVQVVPGQAAPAELAVQCAANRLAYVAPVDGKNTIFTQRLDGTGRTQLVSGNVSARLGWSPDGYHIAYVVLGETAGSRIIRIADVDSATSRTLTIPGIFTVAHPEWSPDGTRIAFAGNPSGGVRAIYTVRPDGGDLKLLTPDAGEKTVPAWSPDGTRMAYLRVLGPAQELWVMKADGTERQMLSSFSDGGYNHVDWSPDGTRLVFSKLEGGQWDLFTIRPDGTGETPLTRTAGVSEQYAAYLPDGRIGFNVSPRFAPQDFDIWIINADGTGAANATSTPGFSETVPAWQ
jgi:Tol biopolymer transport system component